MSLYFMRGAIDMESIMVDVDEPSRNYEIRGKSERIGRIFFDFGLLRLTFLPL